MLQAHKSTSLLHHIIEPIAALRCEANELMYVGCQCHLIMSITGGT